MSTPPPQLPTQLHLLISLLPSSSSSSHPSPLTTSPITRTSPSSAASPASTPSPTSSPVPPYNPNLTSIDAIPSDAPIQCGCDPSGAFYAAVFYYVVTGGDTYDSIATTKKWLVETNSYWENNIPDQRPVNVTIDCTCGDGGVSMDYRLFLTYPLRAGDSVLKVAEMFGFGSMDLLQRYSEGVHFGAGMGIVFVPFKVSSSLNLAGTVSVTLVVQFDAVYNQAGRSQAWKWLPNGCHI